MHFYKNGNYTVCIMNDGTKIRRTDEDEFIPSFAENVDCCITKNCGMACQWCYEGCTKKGKHGQLFKYQFINSLHPYTEMALNGNDMNHPQLEDFLNFLKDKKVFANITVHQNQFMQNYDLIRRLANEKLIYGIGVSYHHYSEDFINKMNDIQNTVLHTINGILTEEDVENLKGHNLKVLVLGYKKLNRGWDYIKENKETIVKNQNYLQKNLSKIIENKYFKLISFDNLAITQLNVKELMTQEEWEQFYMGDDGGYTFYIDMVKGEFAKNSISPDRYPIGNKSIDDMFDIIRKIEELKNKQHQLIKDIVNCKKERKELIDYAYSN